MAEMDAECLVYLLDSTTKGKAITQDDSGNYTLNDKSYPPSTLLPVSATSGVYSLDTLVFLYQNAQIDSYFRYVPLALGKGLKPVDAPRFKPVKELLLGEISLSESTAIHPDAVDDVAAASSAFNSAAPGDKASISISAAEKNRFDRNSILQCPKRDFSDVLELFSKTMGDSSETSKRPRESGKKSSRRSDDKKSKKDSTRRLVPIIIVPEAATSLITIYNAREFLENGNYEPSEKAKAKRYGGKHPGTVKVKRESFAKNGKRIFYEVYDKTKSFSSRDWERVVAVFALGKSWQFKNWSQSFGNNPAEIFSKGMSSTYMRYTL